MALGRELRALGMKSAFDQPRGSANFDRIAPRRPDDYLCISEVFHKTFLSLDEKGTEAAAATAVAMVTASAVREKPKPIEVRVDRPFLFAIQHRASGACLFLGRLSDPR
jgi:serpin B